MTILAVSFDLPRVERTKRTSDNFYSSNEIVEIEQLMGGEWWELLWLVCAYAGARPEDACALDCFTCHAVATVLLGPGVEIKTVADALGHSTPMTTANIYLEKDKAIAKATKKLGNRRAKIESFPQANLNSNYNLRHSTPSLEFLTKRNAPILGAFPQVKYGAGGGI